MRNSVGENASNIPVVDDPSKRAFLFRLRDVAAGAVGLALLPGCKDDEAASVPVEEKEDPKVSDLDKSEFQALLSKRMIIKGHGKDGEFFFEDLSDDSIRSVEPEMLMGMHRVLVCGSWDKHVLFGADEDMPLGTEVTFSRVVDLSVKFLEDLSVEPDDKVFLDQFKIERGKGPDDFRLKLREVGGKNYFVMKIRGEKFVCPTPYEDLSTKDQTLEFVHGLDPKNVSRKDVKTEKVRGIEARMKSVKHLDIQYGSQLKFGEDGKLDSDSNLKLLDALSDYLGGRVTLSGDRSDPSSFSIMAGGKKVGRVKWDENKIVIGIHSDDGMETSTLTARGQSVYEISSQGKILPKGSEYRRWDAQFFNDIVVETLYRHGLPDKNPEHFVSVISSGKNGDTLAVSEFHKGMKYAKTLYKKERF